MPHRRSILRPKCPYPGPSLAETAQEKPAPRVAQRLVTRAGWRGRTRRRRRERRGRATERPCAAARRRRPGATDGRPNSRCGDWHCRRFRSSERAGGPVAARTTTGTEEHGGRARGRRPGQPRRGAPASFASPAPSRVGGPSQARTAYVTSRIGKTSSASVPRLDTPGPPNAIKPPASAPSRIDAAPSKRTATSMSTLNTRSMLSAH